MKMTPEYALFAILALWFAAMIYYAFTDTNKADANEQD